MRLATQDLATNYVTATTLDSGSKFPILTFSSRKKERLKPRFLPDGVQRGAICWQVRGSHFCVKLILFTFFSNSRTKNRLLLHNEPFKGALFRFFCHSFDLISNY